MMKILLMVFIVQVAFILSTLCGKAFEWCQYKYFTKPRKWEDAVAVCRQNNKTLAHISDTSEAEVISEFLAKSVYESKKVSNTFWIGVRMKSRSFLLQDCSTQFDSDPFYSSLLTVTSRKNGCFIMDRKGLPRLGLKTCASFEQFLCKARTFVRIRCDITDYGEHVTGQWRLSGNTMPSQLLELNGQCHSKYSNHRSCYKKQKLTDIKLFSLLDYESDISERHTCDSRCENSMCIAYVTEGKIPFTCSYYNHTETGDSLRPREFFIRDILDTGNYLEITATRMCDKNTKDSAKPSSVAAKHGLDTSVAEHTVKLHYSTPLLDDSTIPTAIITKPTTDYPVASRFTSVRRKITNIVGSKERSGTFSNQKDMRSNERPLPGSTAHLTTGHVLGSSIPQNTVEFYHSTPVLDDSTFPTVISVRPITDPEVSSLSTTGVTTGDCTPNKVLPQIGKLSNSSCYCGCGNSTNVTMTNEQLVKKIQELRQQLIINKENLSSWKRKHTSAKDDRTSARNIGYVGVAIIIAVLVVIVMIDMPRFLAFMKHLRTHTRSCTRRLAPKTESQQKAPQKMQTGKTNQSSVPMNELNLPKRRRLIFLDDSCC